MPGVNLAELMERQEAKPDPLIHDYLMKIRLARILEQINALLADAYDALGDLKATQSELAAKYPKQDPPVA